MCTQIPASLTALAVLASPPDPLLAGRTAATVRGLCWALLDRLSGSSSPHRLVDNLQDASGTC